MQVKSFAMLVESGAAAWTQVRSREHQQFSVVLEEWKLCPDGRRWLSSRSDDDTGIEWSGVNPGGFVLDIEVAQFSLETAIAQHDSQWVFRFIPGELKSHRRTTGPGDGVGHPRCRPVHLWLVDEHVLLFAGKTDKGGVEKRARFAFHQHETSEERD